MAGENLQPASVVNTDGLGCFRRVEAAGCEHKWRVTGGGKHGCEVPGLLRLNTILGKVKRSLDGTTVPLGPTARCATKRSSRTASIAAATWRRCCGGCCRPRQQRYRCRVQSSCRALPLASKASRAKRLSP